MGANARRALADEYDRKRLLSIRDAQLKAKARAEHKGASSADGTPAVVGVAPTLSNADSGLVDIFDFISSPNSPSPCNADHVVPSYDFDNHHIVRPNHISPELWAAASPRQREKEHDTLRHPTLNYYPKVGGKSRSKTASISATAKGLPNHDHVLADNHVQTSHLHATMCFLSQLFSVALGHPYVVSIQRIGGAALPSPKMPVELARNMACSPDGVPWDVGRMPICLAAAKNDNNCHRDTLPSHSIPCSALVERPISKAEIKRKLAEGDLGPQNALNEERAALREHYCWDEENVIEFDDLIRQSIEFKWGPPESPLRKFQGRVVFDGRRYRVLDQNWEIAMHQELGSHPPTMEVGRSVDAYGLFEGHKIEQADAKRAYIQALL